MTAYINAREELNKNRKDNRKDLFSLVTGSETQEHIVYVIS